MKTEEYFIEIVKETRPNIIILGKYSGMKNKILVADKYGEIETTPEQLLSDRVVGIRSAKDKNLYFRAIIKEKHPTLIVLSIINNARHNIEVEDELGIRYVTTFDSLTLRLPSISTAIDKTDAFRKKLKSKETRDYNFTGEYINNSTFFIIKGEFGDCRLTSLSMLKNTPLGIYNAIDKTEWFKRNLRSTGSKVKVLGEYINNSTPISVYSPYGECKMRPHILLNGAKPNIDSSTDKTIYFVNKSKSIHGDKYDYDKVVYENNKKDIIITCPIHGDFNQSPNNHLSGKGCISCRNEINGWSYSKWEEAGLVSKNFDGFKLYILEVFDFDSKEMFYKIGKTFNTIKYRFTTTRFPYDYKILRKVEGSARYISELETQLQRQNIKSKYIPKKEFGGMTECFSEIESEVLDNTKILFTYEKAQL